MYIDKKNSIGFWRATDSYGQFSNWYLCPISDSHDNKFISSEQAFMYYKAVLFGDFEIAKLILETESQKEIKALGRKVANFSQQKWDEWKYDLMTRVNYLKFSQNPILSDVLLSTGDSYLFEDSPYDAIWGIGRNGDGQNLLGKALMQVRSWIQEERDFEDAYDGIEAVGSY